MFDNLLSDLEAIREWRDKPCCGYHNKPYITRQLISDPSVSIRICPEDLSIHPHDWDMLYLDRNCRIVIENTDTALIYDGQMCVAKMTNIADLVSGNGKHIVALGLTKLSTSDIITE